MTAAFGEPTYTDAPADQVPASANGDSNTPAIDPNDPLLTPEALDVDPEADAYAVLPPLPDGKWRMKAKQVDIEDPHKKGVKQRYIAQAAVKKDGSPYQTDPKTGKAAVFMVTNVEYSVIDHTGDFDGVKLTEYWVKTLIDPRKGTSQAATLILKMGGTLPTDRSHKGYIDALLKILASEPELIYETAWSAECQNCQELAKKRGERQPRAILQGMQRFASTKTPSVHDPMVKCPTCSQMVRAQARLVAPYSLKEAKETRGTGSGK